MSKLMIIEDDESIRRELSTYLEKHGFEVIALDEFNDVAKRSVAGGYDLILLDINLPVSDGHYICKEIRKSSDVPIIIVTSQDTEMDELMSITFGADDFITKPYNLRILLARINSLLRRTVKSAVANKLEHKGLVLDVKNAVVRKGSHEVELTKNELRILTTLIEHKDEIVSRSEIIEELWDSDAFVDDNTLTVNVNRLRKKLDSIGAVDFLTTKRGMGYKV
ncbi:MULTISPECIES: response regulator transcription factor [unclassified Fusibacter]|uniref:response regulator transcription factor n=1 Tax=unclassified Fusibacter TaxID=2624464 RepID=UPI00101159FF|nr:MULTISPECIES: response regulator transcription factor [unclassified Fusibacter]MCK8058617.1 response regulator transcription factor [Fusibacter sp. A2]NPE22613.1 response regulator transcription factor [Fusibacter sp. A1]RXV60178.1 DNA-binding response regulator [Fusibacter sp. A1]